MCCFSGPVQSVTGTNIFARSAINNRQFLVYSMSYKAEQELAMILPLPTPPRSREDAVRFINMERYPNFFSDLSRCFAPPPSNGGGVGLGGSGTFGGSPPLKVETVGSFEASFVPALADFARLDERFRISNELWDQLPQ